MFRSHRPFKVGSKTPGTAWSLPAAAEDWPYQLKQKGFH